MKSAAFNLAFKVHRSEIAFAEGLLKSVEAEAQEDFIEALNSLAGESRYDVNQLEMLIEQARQSVMQEETPKINTNAIEKELDTSRKQKIEYQETIQSLEFQRGNLAPTVIPGINSMLWAIVGGMGSVIIMLFGSNMGFIIGCAATTSYVIFLLVQDISKLNEQKETCEKRRIKLTQDINTLKTRVEELSKKITEKLAILESYGVSDKSNDNSNTLT